MKIWSDTIICSIIQINVQYGILYSQYEITIIIGIITTPKFFQITIVKIFLSHCFIIILYFSSTLKTHPCVMTIVCYSTCNGMKKFITLFLHNLLIRRISIVHIVLSQQKLHSMLQWSPAHCCGIYNLPLNHHHTYRNGTSNCSAYT